VRKRVVADLFCGAGGASTGLLRAAAAKHLTVDLLAVNHWAEAIQTHELNHPNVRHLHEDLAAVDPRRAFPDGRLDLLIAAPECTSHSFSRGNRPISEQSRATAWHPLRWADQLHVDKILIENVPAFREWGPEDRLGRPVKSRRGETFHQYCSMFEAMGYTVAWRVLNAADYGAATTRRRLFIQAHKGRGRHITWPAATHAPGTSLLPGLRPWRAAREIIDWSIEGSSIFNRKKPLAKSTVERILVGLRKFGGPALEPWIVVLRKHLSGKSTRDPPADAHRRREPRGRRHTVPRHHEPRRQPEGQRARQRRPHAVGRRPSPDDHREPGRGPRHAVPRQPRRVLAARRAVNRRTEPDAHANPVPGARHAVPPAAAAVRPEGRRLRR
jgi:DNA (cytosine-5)-methyltransferase 1